MLIQLRYFGTLIFILTLVMVTDVGAQSSPSRFSAGAMLMAGKGTMGNGLSDAPDRDMTFIPIGLFAGVNFKKFRVGLNYEYMMANQNTDPKDVANTNTSGIGTSIGTRLEYYSGVQSFGLVYRASTNYTLEKQTFSGVNATYKGSGFSLQYTRQIKNKIGFVIDYTTEEFTESLATANIKYNRFAIGLIFSNFTGSRGR